MSIENSNADTTTNNEAVEPSLDDFEAEFFSGTAPVEKPTEEVVEEVSETETTVEENTEENTEESAEETLEEETPEEGKQETRAEKRIRELNARFREAERRAEEAERLLEAERKTKTEGSNKEQKETVEETNEQSKAPHWDDEDKDGNKIYPLGQFDPKFNADLVRYTIQEENAKLEQQRTQSEQQRKAREAEAAIEREWTEKLAPAQERYPDFQARGQELIDQFTDLEPAYAKYLTDTIRSIDNGPDVLYYLATNPDLANEIVRKGAVHATVALGRISAQFEKEGTNETPTRTKVTNAPPPPPRTRGNAPPKAKNLDDLDDFESVFFTR